MKNTFDKKFNKELRDVCVKVKAINQEIKKIVKKAKNCRMSTKTTAVFADAINPFLEAEVIMMKKGVYGNNFSFDNL